MCGTYLWWTWITNLSKLSFPCWAHSLPASTSVWFLLLLCWIPPAYTYKCKDKRMLTWLEKNTMRNPSSTNLRSWLAISGVTSLHVQEISWFIWTNSKLHCVSKNVPPLTCYNLYIHGSIATIFGKNVGEKVGNQSILYFPTSSY